MMKPSWRRIAALFTVALLTHQCSATTKTLSSSGCRVQAWVRAEDLAPDTTSHGDLRIKVAPAHCGTKVASVALRLSLDEFAEVKYMRPGAELPPIVKADNQTRPDSQLAGGWMVRSQDKDEILYNYTAYDRALSDPALWVVKAEERKTWTTEATLFGGDLGDSPSTPLLQWSTCMTQRLQLPELVSKDYVIYAPVNKRKFNRFAAFREVDVMFVMQGPPTDMDNFVDASMSIPIAPQTCSVDDHASKREPVKMVGSPFPFPDCYVSAFDNGRLCTANVRVVDPVMCKLDKEDQSRVTRFTNDDRELHQTRLQEQKAKEPAAEAVDGDKREADAAEHKAEKDGESKMGSGAEDDDEDESVGQMIIVKFTHDLSRVHTIYHPRELLEEAQKIEKIVEASEARKQAAKIAAAEKDATSYDAKTAQLLQDRDVPRDKISCSPAAPSRRGFITRIIARSLSICKPAFRRILHISTQNKY
ncbi:hypothetical protein MIND_00531700 [Mycena indigotica]|uniref:Uncharacterized protein n=1 Tax=Mycena indigotica TaxID=2126181 RepID=A0A8H6SZ90_9AGAR|nr:uncharacterized protein MIND_00531700 [Mycena indigotica]KAF7307376.1 hypothetical protein MIND_00531700 [Mycena indigotica]